MAPGWERWRKTAYAPSLPSQPSSCPLLSLGPRGGSKQGGTWILGANAKVRSGAPASLALLAPEGCTERMWRAGGSSWPVVQWAPGWLPSFSPSSWPPSLSPPGSTPHPGLGMRWTSLWLPSPGLPPSSLPALASQLHSVGPRESQISKIPSTQGTQRQGHPRGDCGPSGKQILRGQDSVTSPEPPSSLHMGPQEVWGRGILSTSPGSAGKELGRVPGPQDTQSETPASAPARISLRSPLMSERQRDLGDSGRGGLGPCLFAFPSRLGRPIRPLVVATASPSPCRRYRLGVSGRGAGQGAGAAGGDGQEPSRAVALSPSPAARVDWIFKATRAECQCERRARAGAAEGIGLRVLGPGGRRGRSSDPHAGPPAASPHRHRHRHRHRGLRGPVTPLRGPASFRSAGGHAGKQPGCPKIGLGDAPRPPPPRHPGVPAGPVAAQPLPGATHLAAAPAMPPAPAPRAPRLTWAHR